MRFINEVHAASHLPRAEECAAAVDRLAVHCLNCKNAMTRSVHAQLKKISVVQSKIRDMRNKLIAFDEVLHSQEKAFAELRLARQIPAAYQACVQECDARCL